MYIISWENTFNEARIMNIIAPDDKTVESMANIFETQGLRFSVFDRLGKLSSRDFGLTSEFKFWIEQL